MRLLHPSVSRRHATLRPAREGLIVEDHDSRFGTYLNGIRVRVATAKPGDLIRFGSVMAYRIELGALRLDIAAGGMEVEADNLAIAVARSPSNAERLDAFWRRIVETDQTSSPEVGRRTLIRDVGFRIKPNTLVGILGPSGAGKSTLLHCLASYLPPGRGRLRFDGGHDAYTELDAYRSLIGHVPQRDIVFLPLSARENLHYAARLRLGLTATAEAIEAAVEDVLKRVELIEHSDKPTAVLSGGQRKRLSVAIELLRRPRLLLLDEPTSGLDPAGEAHLMEQLRLVARRGTTVACATHLMDNVRLFDELIVLGVRDGVGHLAYLGPPHELLPRFQCRHYADLYEVLVDGRFEPIEPEPSGSPDGAATRLIADQPAESSGTAPSPRPAIEGLVSTTTDSAWWQVPIITGRALRLLTRDQGLVLAMLAQPALLGLLVGLTQFHADGIFPILFFAIVVAIWLGLNNSARDLVRERRQYLRDRLAGLRPGAYLGAKAAVHAIVGALQLLILLVVLRRGSQLSLTYPTALKDLAAVSTPWLFAITFAAYLGGVALGLLASTLARTEEAAVATLPLLILPQLLLSAVATQATTIGGYERDRPFRPLVMTITERSELPGPAVLVDALSLVCLSRPAAIVAERPQVDHHRLVWIGDLCHLLILLLLTWLVVFVAFFRSEQRWLLLDGLG